MSESPISRLTLPKPNQVWITKESWNKQFRVLCMIVAYPSPPDSSPYGYGVGTVHMMWPELNKKKTKYEWQSGYDTLLNFMKYCRPATRADWVLYADKGWDDLAPNQHGLILASNSRQGT